MSIKQKIASVIDKGGSVTADKYQGEWTNFCLRMKSEMSREIDEALKDMVGINKTGFILQAIQEKLRKKNE